MIISVAEVKELIDFKDWSDKKIERKLKAIEAFIRQRTNNNFQDRDCRRTADVVGGSFFVEALTPFEVGDTVQISETKLNKGLFVVASADDCTFTVDEAVKDEKNVLVTIIHYPADVVECCINLLEWEINNRKKIGIKSETLSRHSVTYEDSSSMVDGYPANLLGCLKHYRKVRC